MFKSYYYLTKPNIIFVNIITAAGGFFTATIYNINFSVLISTAFGLAFIIASGCVINNYLDKNIDSQMGRTKNRALVTGKISTQAALIFAFTLGVLGVLILYFFVNVLTLGVCLLGAFVYLALYTPLKKRSVHGALIGSISGAVPPVVGYTAAVNKIDIAALILFLILVLWQMPHFYAIAIRRFNDYKDAIVPVYPIKKGIPRTKIHILLYVTFFLFVSPSLTIFNFAGILYFAVSLFVSLVWLVMAIRGLNKKTDNNVWSRKMFLFSLIVLTSIFIAIPLDKAFFIPLKHF